MKDKVALIMGGTDSIGTAICREFYAKGAHVIAAYHNASDQDIAKAWQSQQQTLGYEISIKFIDTSNNEHCQAIVKEIESEFKSIDILVNNLASCCDSIIYKDNVQHNTQNSSLDYKKILNITLNVIDTMSPRYYGRIINISAVNMQINISSELTSNSYNTLHYFTKYLSKKVAHKNITVNTINPGYFDTGPENELPIEIKNKIIPRIGTGRLGRPIEIARVVYFLSEKASAYITGTKITINGGLLPN